MMKKARHLLLFAATIRSEGRVKRVGKNIRRVLVHIPKDFLEEFDREIAGSTPAETKPSGLE